MENVENVENVRIVKSVKVLSALAMTVWVGAAMVRLTASAKATAVEKADATSAQETTVDPSLYDDLRWRHIGPFRGGRTVGAAGVAQQPNVFYIGVNNGGKVTRYDERTGEVQNVGPVGRRSSSRPPIRTCSSSRRSGSTRRSTTGRAGRSSIRISAAPARRCPRRLACTRAMRRRTSIPFTSHHPLDELKSLNVDLATAYDVVEGADRAPTTRAVKAVAELQRRLAKLIR